MSASKGSGSGGINGEFAINIIVRDIGLDTVVKKIQRLVDAIKTMDPVVQQSMNMINHLEV